MSTSKLKWYVWNEWLTWTKTPYSWRNTKTAPWAYTCLFSELWKSTPYIKRSFFIVPHIPFFPLNFVFFFSLVFKEFCLFVLIFAVFFWSLVSWYPYFVFLRVVIFFLFLLFTIFKLSALSMYVYIHSDPWQSKIWFRLEYIKTRSLSKGWYKELLQMHTQSLPEMTRYFSWSQDNNMSMEEFSR